MGSRQKEREKDLTFSEKHEKKNAQLRVLLDRLNIDVTGWNCPKFVHVAGTNGKGSVSLKVAKGLQHGFKGQKKIGLFTSPHILSFRERVMTFGEETTMISKEKVVEYLKIIISEIKNKPQDYEMLSFFDVIFVLSCMHLDKCDYVILECGIGGRYDATNVITKAKAVCITSIGLDHTDVLGDTLDKIAREKAEIIKP